MRVTCLHTHARSLSLQLCCAMGAGTHAPARHIQRRRQAACIDVARLQQRHVACSPRGVHNALQVLQSAVGVLQAAMGVPLSTSMLALKQCSACIAHEAHLDSRSLICELSLQASQAQAGDCGVVERDRGR